MALVRWQPFREIDSLQDEMNRLFNTLSTTTPSNGESLTFSPSAEMEETDDAIQLKLEVPGMEPKDLDIQVMADSVSISGERKTESERKDRGVTRSEFRYGRFQRTIPLPARVKNSEVEADYKDGIVYLNMPKQDEERNKVFKVNLG